MPIIQGKKSGMRIWADEYAIQSVLKNKNRRSEEEETSRFAKSINYPYVDLNIFPVDQENIFFIPEEDAKRLKAVVIRKVGAKFKLAVLDPRNKELETYLTALKEKEGVTIEVFVASKSSIERGLKVYQKANLFRNLDTMKADLSGDELKEFESKIKNLVDLEKRIREIPITDVLNIILAGGVKMGASDIHFEPQRNMKIKLRYRIDGVLQTAAEIAIEIYGTLISRIKMLSGMMINVKDIAQDGRFSINMGKNEDGSNKEMDVRVSLLPGNYGETVVMRLLNQDVSSLQLQKIGLKGLAYELLVKESEKKQGMIINSGPTGSGKTSTLYSIINFINTPDKKIITIEDPVEYRLDGVVQTQIEKERGYTFEKGLRAILRQDPDVILIGEIRDEETAETAVHSALTGHLVLSSIHANTAAGVVARMVNLGIKPNLINSSSNAFVAQRLVRTLCPDCKERYRPAQETVDIIKKILSIISPKSKVEIPKEIEHLWRAKGCSKCNNIGYRGRTGIFEILVLSEGVKEKIRLRESEEEITKAALEDGMITMEQDGILKAINGETSLEEIHRVVGHGDYLIDLYERIMIQVLARGLKVEKSFFEKVAAIGNNHEELKKILSNAPIKEVLKYILATGLLMRAGDIHIEPGGEEFKVRLRIDGVLQDIVRLPINEYLALLNEIKLLSGFATETRQGTADGRFSINIDPDYEQIKNKKVEVRSSIILGGYGDIVVLRLLNQSAQATNLEDLQINPVNLEKIKVETSKPNGIIINTGPTGSGKTTTLYSILAKLNKPEVKIITVEDPIEYQIEGIIQTQINKDEGYDFATVMRSLLRQNPDIMMIGEIRDEETAKLAYQAALTGHLVLSTLHANNAAGAVQRLINMGVNISDISSGTNCFMAQRLVRKLCPDCRQEKVPSELEKKKIDEVLGMISPKLKIEVPKEYKIFKPIGCPKCNNIGYRGRICLTEVLQITKEMERFIVTDPTVSELERRAIEEGMLNMLQDGMLRVIKGETSFDEVIRVVGQGYD